MERWRPLTPENILADNFSPVVPFLYKRILTYHCGLSNISLSPKKESVVKVIFLEDVPKVAKVGQTKDVAKGYARNYLFPRKLAILADSSAAGALEAHLKKLVKQHAVIEAEMAELAKKIEGTAITLKAKVGEKDKLYGSVTTADIAGELSKAIAREIDKKRIDLVEPIRLAGVYDVPVRFTHEIAAVITVTVMSDAEGAPVPVKATKAEASTETKKEKKPKKEKAPKAEKEQAPSAEKAEKPAAEKAEKPSKEEKPAKEKKAKAAEAVKEEKPAAEKAEKPAPEEKKEKKLKAKAKKAEEKSEK
jgi:large subunit ribosomal protein L9